MWYVVIIVLIFFWISNTDQKDVKKGALGTSQNKGKKRSDPASTYKSPGYSSYDASSLCRAYKNALDSQNQAELMKIVDQMIGNHWACFYAEDYDTASLYESVAYNSPFNYPIDGSRNDCRGLSLREIFGNQNVEIQARKQGREPYTTPLPYKPKQ